MSRDSATSISEPQFPSLRYLGSKRRLLPRIVDLVRSSGAKTVLDAFAGSCCVAFELKRNGFEVATNDVLLFSFHIGMGVVANEAERLAARDIVQLIGPPATKPLSVAQDTFSGLYFPDSDNAFIDNFWASLRSLDSETKRALALASLYRACVQKRPRGVFGYTGWKYLDGRRAFDTPLRQLFVESVAAVNNAVFVTGLNHRAYNLDAMEGPSGDFELVYLDPPYLTRQSIDEYGLRYHFLEGLASYWTHLPIQYETRTRKVRTPRTVFHDLKTALAGFDSLFGRWSHSVFLVSRSAKSRPTVQEIVSLFRRHGRRPHVMRHQNEYMIGRTSTRAIPDNRIDEYLIIG